MKRKRKHIPLIELLASALADKLPLEERKRHVEAHTSALAITKLFTPDHIALHCWGGADKWWNLDMRLRGPELKAKDAADTSRAAKTTRIETRWKEFMRRTAVKKPIKPPSRWPKRPFSNKLNQRRK